MEGSGSRRAGPFCCCHWGDVLLPLAPKVLTRLTDKDTIVLSDFNNKTGDSVFDDTLKQGLSVQLEQSPFLALVSERKVNDTLKLMGRPAGDRLTPEVTREVCQRTGSKAMLAGSIAGLGTRYVIGLKAVNCNTGDVLAEAQEQAASKEAVLKALDAAALKMRSKLGESLSSVEKHATPVEEATTPSLEALKAYSLGLKTHYAKGGIPALPFYKRAEERKLEGELLLQRRYSLAFLKGDAAQMVQLVSAAMGKPGSEDMLLATQADTEGWYGRLKKAQELTGQAKDSARHNDAKERDVAYQAAAALREVGSWKPEAGAHRGLCRVEAGPNPRREGHSGIDPGACRRYGRGGRSGGPSTRPSRWTRWSRGIGCPRSERRSPWSAKTRTEQSSY